MKCTRPASVFWLEQKDHRSAQAADAWTDTQDLLRLNKVQHPLYLSERKR